MVTIRPASAGETERWYADWSRRLDAWYAPLGAGEITNRRQQGWARASDTMLGLVCAGEVTVGHIAVAHHSAEQNRGHSVALVADVWVEPDHRGRGHGRAARDVAQEWAGGHAPSFGALIWTDDPATLALFAGYPLRNQRMYRALDTIEPAADLRHRPLTEPEYPGWLTRQIAGYAADMADSGSVAAADAAAESARDFAALLPDGLATPGHSWWVVLAGTEPAADIWLAHGVAPGVSFVYAVEVQPRFRGHGYGRAAMRVGEERSRALGDRFLGLNVFGHNAVAIGLYTRMGYRVVEQVRTRDL